MAEMVQNWGCKWNVDPSDWFTVDPLSQTFAPQVSK